MPDFFINNSDRVRIATKWLQLTLWALHIWASAAVIGIFFSKDEATINAFIAIFKTCTFGIAGTLFIIIVNKGADFFITKFSAIASAIPVNTTKTTTETTIVEPVASLPADTTIPAKDINIKASGDINVNK